MQKIYNIIFTDICFELSCNTLIVGLLLYTGWSFSVSAYNIVSIKGTAQNRLISKIA